MKKLNNVYLNIKFYLKNNRGQGMLEYILIVILIGITLVTILGDFGGFLGTKFTDVKDAL